MKVNALILAAGQSSRMGFPKALLRLGEQTFIENLAHTFAKIVENVIIVTLPYVAEKIANFNLPHNCKVIVNNKTNSPRMYSIKLGLSVLDLDIPAFIHNVDTPLIKVSTLEQLLANYSADYFIVPKYKERSGHPILLPPKILKYIVIIDNEQENLRNILKKFNKKSVLVDDWTITLNINTPDEYRTFLSQISH